MTRSSTGGLGPARGVAHESKCLAWAAVYMLAEKPLPRWAGGHRVVAVGGQTKRPVDDGGLLTDIDGWVMVQAKKGLGLGEAPDSALGKALQQLVAVDLTGVPGRPPAQDEARDCDPGRDLIMILTDGSSPAAMPRSLS